MSDGEAEFALQLAQEIEPLLHGHPPSIVGAVLALLTTTWLKGFHAAETPDVTAELQIDLLQMLVTSIVRALALPDGDA